MLHRYMQIPLPARDKLWGHLRALDSKRLMVASLLIAAEEVRAQEQRVCKLLGAASRTTILRSRLGVGVSDAAVAFLPEPASAGTRRLLFPSDGNTYRTVGPNRTHTGQPDPPGVVLGGGPNGTCKPCCWLTFRPFPHLTCACRQTI